MKIFRVRPLLRSFHTTPIQSSEVKLKLNKFQKTNEVLLKTSKDQEKYLKKKQIQKHKLEKTAYTKQQAFHVLKKNHGEAINNLSDMGPTSKSDLQYMSLTRDKRLIYTMLGTSGEQLRDAVLVTRDVNKFLKRNQVEKAVYLTRLAGSRGSAGLNSILSYYLNNQSPNSAIDMYNWSRKWNIPIDDYTYTILFDGISKQLLPVSNKIGEKILSMVDNLINEKKLNITRFNSALHALSNCTDSIYMFQLWEKNLSGVKRDKISYSTLLKGCIQLNDDVKFFEIVNSIMENIPKSCVDERVLFQYCKTLLSRDNTKVQNTAFVCLLKYFEFETTIYGLPEVSKDVQLYELDHWSIEKKFPLTSHPVGLLLDTSVRIGREKRGLDVFENLQRSNPQIMDIGIYHKYMEIYMKLFSTDCVKKTLEVYEFLKTNDFPSSKKSLNLVYKSFKREMLKKPVMIDKERETKLMEQLLKFMKDEEGFTNEEGDKIIPRSAWNMFNYVIRQVEKGYILTECLSNVVCEFSKSILHNQFVADRKKRDEFVYIQTPELMATSLVMKLHKRLTKHRKYNRHLPNVRHEKIQIEYQLNKYKCRILDHVNIFSNKNKRRPDIERIEKNLKTSAKKYLKETGPTLVSYKL